MRWFWRGIWNISEFTGIGLGKLAPIVFGLMLGRKGKKQSGDRDMKHRTTIALSPAARHGLESLFTALDWQGQRGAVLNAGLERVGLMASVSLQDTVEALEEVKDYA